MRRIAKWFFLLSKRLYKKLSFVLVLVLIPLCVLVFWLTAQQDSGFLHIVVAQGNNNTGTPSIITALQNSSEMIRFTQVESPEAAVEAVKRAQADEAWIFPEDPEAASQEWVKGKRDYVVSVVTKEYNTTLQLGREKISQVLYQSCAKAYYLEYIRSELSQLDGFTDEELIGYFDRVEVDDDFFSHSESANQGNTAQKTNYLTSPIRGLLGILILLCGMAATMYYMQDEAAGTFAYVRENNRGLVALGCVTTAAVNVSVVALISLYLTSLAGGFLQELGTLLLYAFSCGIFGLLLKQIFTQIRRYAAILPLLTVVMLGICPVFVDFRRLRLFQLLFPPTYYVNVMYDKTYLVYMLLFSICCLGLSWLLQKIRTVVKIR